MDRFFRRGARIVVGGRRRLARLARSAQLSEGRRLEYEALKKAREEAAVGERPGEGRKGRREE